MVQDDNTDIELNDVTSQPNERLPLGTVLQNGTYRVIKVLAQGGFGITYLAENLTQHQTVVIKEYYKKEWHTRNSATSYVSKNDTTTEIEEKFRKKFEKEAHTIMRLTHPNIVKVFDFFEENGTLYYSMEFIDGYSLSDYIKKNGRMPENKCISLIREISETLGYIHSQNELHLDITPRNIMLTNDGVIKLIDFGVSKHYNEDGSQSTTTPVAHSDGYAPKEQYLSEGIIKFSPATDIYSLAATMYFMLTSTTPPNANDRQQCLEEGRELLNIPLSLSENVRNAILWGMNISRKDRLQNTDEFIQTINGEYKIERTELEENEGVVAAIELLINSKKYKDAYNFCLKLIKSNENVNYANNKIKELLPIIQRQSRNDNKQQILITVVICITVSVVMFVLIYQMSQH